MAGRGRGGGRGRGRGMSFDVREMGLGPGEQLPAPVLQPPPLYPPLEHQPAPMSTNAEMLYMVALKKDLAVFLRDHLALNEDGQVMKDLESQLDWAFIPDELKTLKRRKNEEMKPLARKKAFNLNSLDALEKLEETVDDPDEVQEDKEEDKEGEMNDNEEETEDDVDEEMDDGTDYVNNYFDNGEGFDDDDDGGNDGPVY